MPTALPEAERDGFITATEVSGGVHPSCIRFQAWHLWDFRQQQYYSELAAALGLVEDNAGKPAGAAVPASSGWDIPTIRQKYFRKQPEAGALYLKLAGELQAGRERQWTISEARHFDHPGPAFHEHAVRSLIPGLGTGFSIFGLKAEDMEKLMAAYAPASAGNFEKLTLRFSLGGAAQGVTGNGGSDNRNVDNVDNVDNVGYAGKDDAFGEAARADAVRAKGSHRLRLQPATPCLVPGLPALRRTAGRAQRTPGVPARDRLRRHHLKRPELCPGHSGH
jgi:hypothetical protein